MDSMYLSLREDSTKLKVFLFHFMMINKNRIKLHCVGVHVVLLVTETANSIKKRSLNGYSTYAAICVEFFLQDFFFLSQSFPSEPIKRKTELCVEFDSIRNNRLPAIEGSTNRLSRYRFQSSSSVNAQYLKISWINFQTIQIQTILFSFHFDPFYNS